MSTKVVLLVKIINEMMKCYKLVATSIVILEFNKKTNNSKATLISY